MSDLISREEVLKFIERIKCDKSIPKNYGTLLDIMRFIRNQPFAYDVNNVVKQLECEKDRLENEISVEVSHDMFHRLEARLSQTNFALRIVKGGGVND